MPYKQDTEHEVFFYEQEFYVLSNFSAFQIEWCNLDFPTLEHAYHWCKFPTSYEVQKAVFETRSAHDALKIAHLYERHRRPDWNEVKVGTMYLLMRAKFDQHEYVRQKLRETGNRRLIEDSWRDAFWGWGPNRDGQNMCGELWMRIRGEKFC